MFSISTEAPPSNEESPEISTQAPSIEKPSPSEAEIDELKRILTWSYRYENAVKLPSKLTATALPQEETDPDAETLVKGRSFIFRLPDFANESRPLSGAERGTATHILMQFIDFAKTDSLSAIEGEITRIFALGQLTARQATAVDRASILSFFASDTGVRIKTADKVHRELRFSLLCPAAEFFADAEDENILLQGVVDCCIEEHGSLIVIDYKTDYVTKETLSEITEHYRKQISAYAYAMSRIFDIPVSSCLLCFLRAGLVSELKP